ncbi:hypothetical protein V2J09_023172 [Rumex salicifolius]
MASDLNHKDTELRLGLPGTVDAAAARGSKRASSDANADGNVEQSESRTTTHTPPTKAQVVGWPPIRKNSFAAKKEESSEVTIYVKVSMDGAPFLRKIDIKVFKGYPDLIKSLESMFKFTIGDFSERDGYKGSEFVPTYEDKDGDWMLVGDVPWEMFITSCKRLRIMKGSEAKGLACFM